MVDINRHLAAARRTLIGSAAASLLLLGFTVTGYAAAPISPEGTPCKGNGSLDMMVPGAGVFAFVAGHTPSSLDNATGFRCGR